MEDFRLALKQRHSVRDYKDDALTSSQVDELNSFIARVNVESGLDISLHVNEDIFSKWILGYGFIKNCHNYLRFGGPSSEVLAEKVGYYGEMVILKAQQLGLHTCWVGGTYRKKDVSKERSTLVCVAALGVGKTEGKPSKSAPIEAYYEGSDVPDWFLDGMVAVALAPSAVNQKKWTFRYLGEGNVEALKGGKHFPEVDLGIAKLHFELGAKRKVFAFPNSILFG